MRPDLVPAEDGAPSLFERLRGWVGRDLYDPRPFSVAFAILPLLPWIIAEKFQAPPIICDVLFWPGMALATLWFAYVQWRAFGSIGRRFGASLEDLSARGSGAEPPTRCPVCHDELPAFTPPDDGVVYRFRGWTCGNCGAQVSVEGHQA